MRRASTFTTTIADLISSGAANLLGIEGSARALSRISARRNAVNVDFDADAGRIGFAIDRWHNGYALIDGRRLMAVLSTTLPDGSILLAGGSGSLVTSAGTWTFSTSTNASGSLVLLNGASAASGSATKLEVANNGQLYADIAQGQWYEWVDGGWSGVASPTVLSPDGSILLAGGSGSLVTSAGTWTFSTSTNGSGSLVPLNGASAAGGSATKLEVANNGQLYADNAQGASDNEWGTLTAGWTYGATAGQAGGLSPDGSTPARRRKWSACVTSAWHLDVQRQHELFPARSSTAQRRLGGERLWRPMLEIANNGQLYADNAQGAVV